VASDLRWNDLGIFMRGVERWIVMESDFFTRPFGI
jgi:hypothetical protein